MNELIAQAKAASLKIKFESLGDSYFWRCTLTDKDGEWWRVIEDNMESALKWALELYSHGKTYAAPA